MDNLMLLAFKLSLLAAAIELALWGFALLALWLLYRHLNRRAV